MTRKQAEKETAGGRVRLTVYMPKDEAEQLYALIEEMPFRVTVSGFIETAIKEAMARVRADGIKLQLHPRK